MIPSIPRAAVSRSVFLAVVVTLAAPMVARAADPTVVANPATNITPSAVTLSGSVNPGGLATTWRFVYGDNANFLILGPLLSMPPANLAAGANPVNVSARLANLAPETTYYFSLIAQNVGGSGYALPAKRFKTLHASPEITSGAATDVTSTSVTLNGSVTANGAFTDARFDFSTDPLFASVVPVGIIEVGEGRGPVPVTTTVRGLQGGTTNYHRLKATNEGGETKGELQAVTLLPAAPRAEPAPPAQPAPPVATPSPPAAPTVGSSGSAAVRKSGSTLTVTDGHKVTCVTGCSLRLVATARAPKAKKKRKPITIARATVKVAAGKTSALTFKLNATGAKLLRAKRKLTATVTLKVSYGGASTLTTTHRVVLRAPKKARTT